MAKRKVIGKPDGRAKILATRGANSAEPRERPEEFTSIIGNELPQPGLSAVTSHDDNLVPCHGGDAVFEEHSVGQDTVFEGSASENQNLQDPAASMAIAGPAIDEAVAKAKLEKTDCWQRVGQCLARVHGCERTELFTPFRVPGGPLGRDLFSVRLTKGKFRDGTSFEKLDSFRNRYTAHEQLSGAWTGMTLFFPRSAYDMRSQNLCDHSAQCSLAVRGSGSSIASRGTEAAVASSGGTVDAAHDA